MSIFNGVDGIIKVIEKKPVTFVHGDNMAFLRKAKEEMMFKHWHYGIVDPPYGISVGNMRLGSTTKSKPRNYEMGQWDNAVPTEEYWDLLKYCCRDIIVWGGNYFSDFIPAGRCFLVWDKYDRGKSFADGELALTTIDESARIIQQGRNKRGDDDGEKRHPTQKPVYLYDYLHLNFVEKRQRVLDTHGGSFNHAIAAIRNNVDLTIIEREESYFKSGLQACENVFDKPRLLF